MNVCSAIVVVRPVASSSPERVLAVQRHAESPPDERDEQQQDRGRAEHAELLSERREDEVARGVRDQVGEPRPRPVPTKPPEASANQLCASWP